MFDRFEHDGKGFHYSTFLDGLQRVLLIIDDFTLAYRAQVVIVSFVAVDTERI